VAEVASTLPGPVDPESVFKAYDIRGRTDTGELDAELYRRVGVALVSLLSCERVAVGRDCRETSIGFSDALAAGVTQAGADVIDLGLVPTDAVYYYSGAEQVPGAMITASHNPAGYNGLKLCRPGAAPIGVESGLAEIKDLVVNWSEPPQSARTGSIGSVDLIVDYVDHLFRIVPAETIGPLRVAVDGGNGMAGIAIHQVMDRIPVTMTGLFLEPDGSFPNHPADPLVPENLQDLETLMRTEGFDLGVAFDGDADRAVFLDDSAASIPGSTITSLVARRMLAEAPGSAVVHNLITSKAVPEIVVEAGGTPVRTRVGHSYIKQVMAETDAIFGGEHSGHYYFRANFRADSGMLAMLYLLQVMTEDHRPLSAIRADVERYAASGEINFTVADSDAVIDRVEQSFPDAGIDRLDGLTVDMGTSWFNLRPSNTEPLLRLNAEAEDEKAVAALVARVTDIVENRT